jgi:hypothetical protein
MPSLEHIFQPHIVSVPDNKTGDITNDPQLEPPQHSPLVESSSTTNQHLEVLKPYASAVLAFTHERVSTDLESTQSFPSRQSVPIDTHQIREKRREQFEQTGYIPRIFGGAPDTKAGTEEPDQKLTLEGRELTWGECLSKDGFWVLDYLHGIGPTKHLRELAGMEGIDYDVGLEELRRQGLLDESNPEYPEVKLPKPKGLSSQVCKQIVLVG